MFWTALRRSAGWWSLQCCFVLSKSQRNRHELILVPCQCTHRGTHNATEEKNLTAFQIIVYDLPYWHGGQAAAAVSFATTKAIMERLQWEMPYVSTSSRANLRDDGLRSRGLGFEMPRRVLASVLWCERGSSGTDPRVPRMTAEKTSEPCATFDQESGEQRQRSST